jgi:EmrB/QacA subfamily drug resistance transporter
MLASRSSANLKWYTLLAACFALFMAILDNLVVNVALPTISQELDASTTQLQWIVSAYTLVFASLQITAGGLGDRFGRKRWFLIGTALFVATSLMAAFATNIETLIAARALQGLGAALIMPLSLSLISDAFPPEERGRALGIWSAVSVSGLALGPIVGGVLVEYASWNWIFLVNVPVGIAAMLVTLAVVRESRDTSGTVATDVPGTVLITGAIGALTWGLIEAGERGWSDRLIVTALAAAVVLGAAFIWVESRTARPMVPLRFFRSSTFTGANVVAFAIAFTIAGVAFFWTLYQQNIHGYSAVRTGVSLVPLVLVMMVGAPFSGALANRFGASKLIAAGMLISGSGVLLYLRAGVDAAYLDILPSLLVMGLGNSLIFAPMTTAVLNSVESAKSGVASAINGAVREIGTAFGIALLGTVMNRTYQDHFDASPAVGAIRADPAQAPLQPVLDVVGSGAGLAGRVVENPQVFPGLPGAVAAQLREVSAEAFMAGMDRAVIVATAAMVTAAIIALFTIKDSVVSGATPVVVEEEEEAVPVLLAGAAD